MFINPNIGTKIKEKRSQYLGIKIKNSYSSWSCRKSKGKKYYQMKNYNSKREELEEEDQVKDERNEIL